jgi:hypothetical protein
LMDFQEVIRLDLSTSKFLDTENRVESPSCKSLIWLMRKIWMRIPF